MPPLKPHQQPSRFYSSVMTGLLKFKTLLNLVISDLLLLIFAILLFLAIVGATFAALYYQQWLPAISAYVQGIATSTAAATAR